MDLLIISSGESFLDSTGLGFSRFPSRRGQNCSPSFLSRRCGARSSSFESPCRRGSFRSGSRRSEDRYTSSSSTKVTWVLLALTRFLALRVFLAGESSSRGCGVGASFEGVACFSPENVEFLKTNSKHQILSFDSDVTGVKNSLQITINKCKQAVVSRRK